MRSLAILGLLLVTLGALRLYQGIAEEGLAWLSWVRGSLAIASGLVLVVLSLNRARCTQAFIGQATISRLCGDASLDCAAGRSGGVAAEVNGIGPKKIATGNAAEAVNQQSIILRPRVPSQWECGLRQIAV